MCTTNLTLQSIQNETCAYNLSLKPGNFVVPPVNTTLQNEEGLNNYFNQL
jgi:hypothetical protein